MGAIKKAGVEFFAKIDTNRDLIGKASEFTAEVIVDADGTVLDDSATNASIGAFSEVGSTGIYRAPITLTDEGDYTVSVKWTDGTDTEYIPFPVEVKSADMSDIKALIDTLQTDMTAVKGQVDTLDEAELNGIAEQVTALADHVATIEGLLDGDDNASLEVLKQLLEDINGNEGIEKLKTFVDNVELMLEGKEYVDTEGNTVAADDSKGLVEIYNAIAANGTSIADANTAISDLSNQVSVFRTSVETKVDDVQAAVDALTDDTNADSLVSKINAVKTVVDANSDVLTDAGFGNEALKNLIDTLDTNLDALIADFADGGRLEVRFDTIDTAISDLDGALSTAKTEITDAITAQTTHLDGRLDDIDAALGNISGAQQYKGFV
jgi:hypothetical protein